MSDNKLFQDKTVVVTGAAAGMGEQIAKDFYLSGATVVAVDINEEALDELKYKIEALSKESKSKRFITYVGDISKEETNDAMIKKAVELTGKLDVLVNNAGVAGHSEPIADTSNEDWNRILSVDLNGPMYAIRAAVKQFLTQESGGNIVTIASMAGLKGCRSCAAYGVAKHGLIGLSENTAFMYMHKNIRSNVVCPGAIRTGMTSRPELENEFGRERIRAGMDPDIPFGTPKDVANAVLFLASDNAKFINGASLVVDGGISCN